MAGRLRTIDARTLADAVLEPPGYAVKDLLCRACTSLRERQRQERAGWRCGCASRWQAEKRSGDIRHSRGRCSICAWRTAITGCRTGCMDITEDPSENLYLATHAGTLADGLAGQIETFVREHGRVSLIVIDTLQKVRENLYGQYLCEGLCRPGAAQRAGRPLQDHCAAGPPSAQAV